MREQVRNALLENERKRKLRPLIMHYTEFVEDADFSNYHAATEAVSLMVQVLTRSITNNFSKEDAAKVLFRDHSHGTGSGWLPDYLDGLPGIEVDREACAAIADLAGPSELCEAITLMRP
jgi:hypothetical protein